METLLLVLGLIGTFVAYDKTRTPNRSSRCLTPAVAPLSARTPPFAGNRERLGKNQANGAAPRQIA